jgi:hypothetical protein
MAGQDAGCRDSDNSRNDAGGCRRSTWYPYVFLRSEGAIARCEHQMGMPGAPRGRTQAERPEMNSPHTAGLYNRDF